MGPQDLWSPIVYTFSCHWGYPPCHLSFRTAIRDYLWDGRGRRKERSMRRVGHLRWDLLVGFWGARARRGNPPTGIHFFYLTFVGFPPLKSFMAVGTNLNKCKKRNVLEDSGIVARATPRPYHQQETAGGPQAGGERTIETRATLSPPETATSSISGFWR